jgi:HSP20 family molecular chaperone IbpA
MNTVQQNSIRILHLHKADVRFEAEPWTPPLNALEIDHAFVVIVDLAGIQVASVRIDVHPALLAIYGVRQVALPKELSRLYWMGIKAGRFQAMVPISSPIDPEQTTAHYADGLLEVVMPFALSSPPRMVIVAIQ